MEEGRWFRVPVVLSAEDPRAFSTLTAMPSAAPTAIGIPRYVAVRGVSQTQTPSVTTQQ